MLEQPICWGTFCGGQVSWLCSDWPAFLSPSDQEIDPQ
jgi:hypothetical protein